MNLAIYAISKNVESVVDRFMDSIPSEVPVYVLDHSTDGTAEKLRQRGAIVDATPIKRDFAAFKNKALSLVPRDVAWCLNVDLDEVLDAEALRRLMAQIDESATRIYHSYKPDVDLDRTREESRLHRREYEWVFPIHECLVHRCVKSWPYQNWGCATATEEKIQIIEECILTQHPDKHRTHTWSSMLLDAVKEYPLSPRMRMLAGRDLYFDAKYDDAMEQFEKFVELKNTNPFELSYVMTMAARCQKKTNRLDLELAWLQSAARVAKRRESWVELAYAYLLRGQYESAQDCALSSLDCTEGRSMAHNDPAAWSYKPHEIAMHAAYNLDDLDAAMQSGETALTVATASDRERILGNVLTFKEKRDEMSLMV